MTGTADWRALLADPGASDAALLELAGSPDADAAALAALAADEARLRRAPALAAAIFSNPRAPMSVANRAVITCVRVAGAPPELPELPELGELARAIAADPAAMDAAGADAAFAALVRGGGEGEGGDRDDDRDEEAAEEAEVGEAEEVAAAEGAGPAKKRRSAVIDFGKLKLYEKIRLATLGNAYCRKNLLRDSNRMVALAAIRSPRITDGEVIQAAGNRALSEDVIRYIANRKELVKLYAVKKALIGNPKCPLALSLRLLPLLQATDVQEVARSKNVPAALAVAAKKLAAARAPK